MKWIKRIAKFLGAVLILLVITSAVILFIDHRQTAYLEVDKDENASLLISNVHVISMRTDSVMRNKMILIRDGRIQQIADQITVEGAEMIDGKGGYIMPGLIDMHVHVWDRYELGLYLANGITTVRNLWGMPMHLRMKKAISSGEIFGPTFLTTGPKLTGREFVGSDNLQLMSPEEAREKVISYKDRGYDFIKTYYGLDQDIFDALIQQAEASEMDIVAHPSQKVPYDYHFNTAILTIEHTEDVVQRALNYELDSVKLAEVIEGYAEALHVSHCPTLTVFHNIYRLMNEKDIVSEGSLKNMNSMIGRTDAHTQYDRWQETLEQDSSTASRILTQHLFHLYIISELHKAGVNIVCGTDAGIGVTEPGYAIHRELQFYKEAGLSNFEVLKTATVNPTRVHDQLKDMGTIQNGKIANLVLMNANPLEDLSALKEPSVVIVNGQLIEQDRLNEFKAKAKGRKNFLASVLRYAENMVVEKF